MKKLLSYLSLALLASSCFKFDSPPEFPITSEGYRPIYANADEIDKVVITTPQPLKSPGKIYIKDQFLFVNEIGRGVHIFDNKDPKNPKKIAFLQIPSNVDIAIRGDILYADNLKDLISINISKPSEAKLVHRLKDVFESQDYPPVTNVRFECVDSNKGVVIGWEKVLQVDYTLKCYR